MAEDSQNNNAIGAHIEFEESNMKAFFVFEESVEGQNPPNAEDLNKIIDQAGIKFGIKSETIKEILEGERKDGRLLIAEGMPPQAGEDAKLEFNFKTDKSLRPKILDDGHIDYKEISLVNSVTKDDVLITKTEAKPGIKGTDIFGKEIHAIPGKDFDIVVGPGTYKDPKDSLVIKASADGIIFYNDKKRSVEVQKLYTVPKSVDFSTGNINVKSSVDIKGDVKPHFSITTPYNVQVKGIVENATITCGGTLSVLGGIVGDGKQVIEATGDIHSGYINNQRIKCHGSVYISTEVRNTYIDCDDEVIIVKDSGVIIGGKISATNKISAATVGNAYYVPTELELGVKLELKEKYLAKEAEKNAMQKQVDEIKKEIEEAGQDALNEVGSPYLKNLNARGKECTEKLEKLRKEFKEIEVEYHNVANSVVTISRKVYPGTTIKIKNAVFEVKEELSNVKFVYESGMIKCINR